MSSSLQTVYRHREMLTCLSYLKKAMIYVN